MGWEAVAVLERVADEEAILNGLAVNQVAVNRQHELGESRGDSL